MSTHDELLRQIDVYIEENTKFSEKGVKAAAGRARKALNEVRKLAATRRKEITEAKNALAVKKD
jgi:transposase